MPRSPKPATIRWAWVFRIRSLIRASRQVDRVEYVDMCRYDTALISDRPEFAGLVAIPRYMTRHGALNDRGPTFGRWRSYLIDLQMADDETQALVVRSLRTEPDAWYTYTDRPHRRLALPDLLVRLNRD